MLAPVKVRSSPCSPCSAKAPARGSAWLRSSLDLRCAPRRGGVVGTKGVPPDSTIASGEGRTKGCPQTLAFGPVARQFVSGADCMHATLGLAKAVQLPTGNAGSKVGCRRMMAVGTLCLIGMLAVAGPAEADDPAIPTKCRSREAGDQGNCADLIEARFEARNRDLNKRDKAVNAAVEARILASHTLTGETVSQAFDYLTRHKALVSLGWHFVYSRGGTEYAVWEYGEASERSRRKPGDYDPLSLFDDDYDADGIRSIRYSSALGYVVWKVTGTSTVPWGNYARIATLGPRAFTWAINHGQKGFSDGGFDPFIEKDLSFFAVLPAGDGKLSARVDTTSIANADLYASPDDKGFVVQGDNLSCPAVTYGIFTVQGPDCEKKAAAVKEITGKVLPFQIISAVRNHAYKDGMVEAAVSVSVEGGRPQDWIATAAYVAEHSMVADATFNTTEVYFPNPWGDMPPQHVKLLAKAYYAPDPTHSPWQEKWAIIGADHAPTLADVEYDKLSNDLIEDPDKVPDPDKRLNRAAAAARKAVIAKYGLPPSWQPTVDLGLDGQEHDGDHVHVEGADADEVAASLAALSKCLTSDNGNMFLMGCPRNRGE